MMRSVTRFLSQIIIRYIEKPVLNYQAHQFVPLTDLRASLQPGDVLLVEGNQRISTAIKYLTQSTWSHAALYIGDDHTLKDEFGYPACLIEADVSRGAIASSLTKYLGYNVKNVIDLARYLLPQPPVPIKWRRRMIALGSGEPSQAICSTLIARAFQSVGYPILPDVTVENQREVLHIRHHSLFTPRDFDVSPYFDIVKPLILKNPDYKNFNWHRQAIDSHET
jgi:cell wall-associated NlpC family hydrolase